MTGWDNSIDIFRRRGNNFDISGLATEALAYLIACCVGYESEGRSVPWELRGPVLFVTLCFFRD
jgi:hypothetical protein